MEWLVAVATEQLPRLREWFLAGPWTESTADGDLCVYEIESGGDRWLAMTQGLPVHDRQLEWRARDLARHCEAATGFRGGSGADDWMVAAGEDETGTRARLSQLPALTMGQQPVLQLRLDSPAQQRLFRQFLVDLPALLERHLPIRGGRGELLCAQHRLIEPGDWSPTAVSYDGLLATTLQLLVFDEQHRELAGIREQEIAFCSFPWLTPNATFVQRGKEYRQPINELAADYLAAIERDLTESIPARLHAVPDWSRTTPQDILREPAPSATAGGRERGVT